MQFSTTALGTSNPIDLCDGRPLFPSLGQVQRFRRRETTSVGTSSFSIGRYRFVFTAFYGYFFGFCGPSVAGYLEVEGTLNPANERLSLTFSNDELAAGLLAGATVTVGFSGAVRGRKIVAFKKRVKTIFGRTRYRWRFRWETFFKEFGSSTDIELVEILFTIIEFIIGRQARNAEKKGSPNDPPEVRRRKRREVGESRTADFPSASITTVALDLTAYAENPFSEVKSPKATVTPRFRVDLDLIPLVLNGVVPGLGSVVVGLAGIGLGVSVGPSFGFEVPVEFTLHTIQLTDGPNIAVYSLSNRTGSDPFTNIPRTGGTFVSNPTGVGLTIRHNPTFDILFGVFYSVTCFKWFSKSARREFGVLGLMGITVDAGTFSNTYSNAAGSSTLAAAPEIIFEEPALA